MKTEEIGPQFEALITASDCPVRILIAQVDPDAIGSALALRYLIKRFSKREASIFYSGEVSHPQNKTLMNLLNLDSLLTPISTLLDSAGLSVFTEQCEIALVDSSMIDDARLGPLAGVIDPLIVIDHHKSSLRPTPEKFIWIDERVGSASTMMVELCLAMVGQVDDLGSIFGETPEVARALAMGIYTDTHSLMSAGERDRDAWSLITKWVNHRELHPFIDYPISEQHLKNWQFVLEHMDREGAVMVATCGYIDPQDGDDLSTFADYLLRLEGITEVYVWGIVGDKVRVSARSLNVSTPLHQRVREYFGRFSGAKVAPDGRGEGGAMMLLNLGDWGIPETREQIRNLVSTFIQAKVFAPPPENAG